MGESLQNSLVLRYGSLRIKFDFVIVQRFENTFLKLIKMTENEISTAEYRSMVENMKDSPDSRDKVMRERNAMTKKITKLREEITILENNIGFFSNSKQSEIMRAEYEKKISRAKNEVKVLEAKLKILNGQ